MALLCCMQLLYVALRATNLRRYFEANFGTEIDGILTFIYIVKLWEQIWINFEMNHYRNKNILLVQKAKKLKCRFLGASWNEVASLDGFQADAFIRSGPLNPIFLKIIIFKKRALQSKCRKFMLSSTINPITILLRYKLLYDTL